MSMLTLIIKSNPASVTNIIIRDLGYDVMAGGVSVIWNDPAAIEAALNSEDLRTLIADNAFAPSPTPHSLILNDGVSDIDPADAESFLDGFETSRRHNYIATSDPLLTNDLAEGYDVGSQWFNTLTNTFFMCANAASGAAVWIKLNRESGVEEAIVFPFTFSDPSINLFGQLNVGDEIIESEIEVTTAFDDGGAQLRLGTPADPTMIFDITDNDPTTVAVYNVSNNIPITIATQIRLTIVAGTSTQGAGEVVVSVRRA